MASRSPALRPAASLETYIANPIGYYIAGTNAAAFWFSPALDGVSFWGHPGEADADIVASGVRAAAWPSTCLHACLIDLRKLQCLDLRVFDKLWSDLASLFRGPDGAITRRALLAPGGQAGRVLTALFTEPGQNSWTRSFTDPLEALAWLDADRSVLDDLDHISDLRATSGSLLRDLQRILEDHPRSRAAEAARHLGISQRTLQRRLGHLGTTFQQELHHAHLQTAKRFMRDTDRPLKWIASESGYSSLHHFSSSFRARVGMSPSQWRTHPDK